MATGSLGPCMIGWSSSASQPRSGPRAASLFPIRSRRSRRRARSSPSGRAAATRTANSHRCNGTSPPRAEYRTQKIGRAVAACGGRGETTAAAPPVPFERIILQGDVSSPLRGRDDLRGARAVPKVGAAHILFIRSVLQRFTHGLHTRQQRRRHINPKRQRGKRRLSSSLARIAVAASERNDVTFEARFQTVGEYAF